MGMADETQALTAALAGAPERLAAGIAPVVSRGALNIKNDWRASASGLKHAPLYPFSIGYDLDIGVDHVGAEIGPDKNLPQGALGNLIEYGSSKNAPHDDGGRALAAEEPRFIAALEDVAEQAVLP